LHRGANGHPVAATVHCIAVVQAISHADYIRCPSLPRDALHLAGPSIGDDGLVLHESLAINLYLGKRYGGPLGPADIAEDGKMGMWSLWAATEVEPHSIQVLYHRASYPPEKRDPSVAQAAIDALRAPFGVLDRELAGSSFLVGDRFTVADINVAEVVRYALPAPELFAATPALRGWLAACHARPAYKRMMADREREPE
jgi:glutathione S-transferase